MKLLYTFCCLIGTGWVLGWLNRGFTYDLADAIPFSKSARHTLLYNGLFLSALVVFSQAVWKLPRPHGTLRQIARNVRPALPAVGALKLFSAGLLLMGSVWVGDNSSIPDDLFQLPLLFSVPYSWRAEVAQLSSLNVVLPCAYSIIVIYAYDRIREESEKRAALEMNFALQQRRRGITAPLIGQDSDVDDSDNDPPMAPPGGGNGNRP